MRSSSLAVAISEAVRQQAISAGKDTPSIRGGDWRSSTVSTVGTDGTVTTSDGIVARRRESYELPAVGDLIVLSKLSSGEWLADGRLAPVAGDGWQTPTLTAPWVNYTPGGFQVARYRRVGAEVIIEGLLDTNGTSVSGTLTIFTLPVGYRPPLGYIFPAMSNSSTARQLSILTTGVVQVSSLPVGAVGFLSINCRFSLT